MKRFHVIAQQLHGVNVQGPHGIDIMSTYILLVRTKSRDLTSLWGGWER